MVRSVAELDDGNGIEQRGDGDQRHQQRKIPAALTTAQFGGLGRCQWRRKLLAAAVNQ